MNTKLDIIWVVNKGALSDYFERNYLDYQKANGRMSLAKFAQVLKFSRGFLSQLLEGDRTSMTYHTAVYVAQVLNDYSIMEILGYETPSPVEIDGLSAFPSDVRAALESAKEKIISLGVAGDSPEAQAAIEEALKPLGYTRTTKDGFEEFTK